MSRLLFLVAIIAGVYWLLKSYRRQGPDEDAPPVEDMVRCAVCGVHLPRSEAMMSGGKFYCSEAHLKSAE